MYTVTVTSTDSISTYYNSNVGLCVFTVSSCETIERYDNMHSALRKVIDYRDFIQELAKEFSEQRSLY